MSLRGSGYDGDVQRVRAGLIVLLVGVVLLLGALSMALLRGPEPPADLTAGPGHAEPVAARNMLPARFAAALLVLGGILVVTLFVAGYALIRLSRRYAGLDPGKPTHATATDDVWQMHRLPEAPAEDDDFEPDH